MNIQKYKKLKYCQSNDTRRHKYPNVRAGGGCGRRSTVTTRRDSCPGPFACIQKYERYLAGQHFYSILFDSLNPSFEINATGLGHCSLITLAKWTHTREGPYHKQLFLSGVDQCVTSLLIHSQLRRHLFYNRKQKLHTFIGLEKKEKVGDTGSA